MRVSRKTREKEERERKKDKLSLTSNDFPVHIFNRTQIVHVSRQILLPQLSQQHSLRDPCQSALEVGFQKVSSFKLCEGHIDRGRFDTEGCSL